MKESRKQNTNYNVQNEERRLKKKHEEYRTQNNACRSKNQKYNIYVIKKKATNNRQDKTRINNDEPPSTHLEIKVSKSRPFLMRGWALFLVMLMDGQRHEKQRITKF